MGLLTYTNLSKLTYLSHLFPSIIFIREVFSSKNYNSILCIDIWYWYLLVVKSTMRLNISLNCIKCTQDFNMYSIVNQMFILMDIPYRVCLAYTVVLICIVVVSHFLKSGKCNSCSKTGLHITSWKLLSDTFEIIITLLCEYLHRVIPTVIMYQGFTLYQCSKILQK